MCLLWETLLHICNLTHARRTLLLRAKVMRIYLRPSPLRTSSHPLPLFMPTVGFSLTRRASLSMQASEPPPLPAQLNANIHQSPLHSPRFHHPLLCAHACRTVGLIRPLLFTRVKQTTQQFGCRTTAEPDQMSVHCFSSLSLRDEMEGGERCTKFWCAASPFSMKQLHICMFIYKVYFVSTSSKAGVRFSQYDMI